MQSPSKNRLPAWLAALVLLSTLFAANFPYLHGYSLRPAGSLFWAVPPVNYGDAEEYLAFTRDALHGRWLQDDPFTSEPHARGLFLPQVHFQALLCRLTGWGPLESFQASRVLSGLALLVAGWWFGCLLLRRARTRLLFLGLLCFSAGASRLLEWIGVNIPNGDWAQPEGNTFFALGNLPHVALSCALLTGLFATLPVMERDGRFRWALLTFALSVLLSWTHPFDFMTLALGLGSYALVRWIELRKPPRASLRHGAALLLGALPAAVYLVRLTHVDPIYHQLANDILRVQPWSFYAVAHGLLGLPALIVLFHPTLRRRFLLPLCWVIPVFLFLLLPFPMGGKQCRLVGGIHVPLALLATVGIDWLGCRLALGRWRRWDRGRRLIPLIVSSAYLLVTMTGTWGMFERHLSAYSPRGGEYYLSGPVQGLFAYLNREGNERQVTLGGSYTGGWAPVLADTHSYWGHWHMTLHEPQKRDYRDWFFTTPGLQAQRAAFLEENRITWVIWCPGEWRGNAVPLEDIPGLERVYTAPEMALYRFSPRGS